MQPGLVSPVLVGRGPELASMLSALRALMRVMAWDELEPLLGPARDEPDRLLPELVRALRGVRVLLVVTFRSDELHRGHALRPLVTGWERVRSVRRLELQRFSREETAGQLEAILGAPPERPMLELLYERSEGNAFLIEE